MNAAPKRVRKRDGREVPFDLRKVETSILRALVASGEEDPGVAVELAAAVGASAAALQPRRRPLTSLWSADAAAPSAAREGVIGATDLDDLVERVLRETGRERAARAYAAVRDDRHRARRAIQVVGPAGGADEIRTLGSGSQPWSKGRIVEALLMEADVPRPIAEAVASAVESRVFSSGFRRVTTALVRELVDSELFSRGLEVQRKRQAVVGLPKHDLREALKSGFLASRHGGRAQFVAWTGRVEDRIARHVLARFTLEEVLTPALAERHLAGDLHFEGLDRPHRDGAAAFDVGDAVDPRRPAVGLAEAPSFEEALDRLRAFVLACRDESVESPVFHGFEGFLRAALRAPRRERIAAAAARVLAAVVASKPPGGAPPILSFLAESPTTAPLLEAWAALPPEGEVPRVVLASVRHPVALPEVLPLTCARVAGRASLLSIAFGARGASALAPGVRLVSGARTSAIGCGSAAVVNLPRLAYEAGSFQEGRLLELLVARVDEAIEGLTLLERFRSETVAAKERAARGGARESVLAVAGLREAVRLVHEGVVEPLFAREIVQTIVERMRAVAPVKGLTDVRFEPWFPSAARARFEDLDAERCPLASKFSDGDRVRYSEGATLSPMPGETAGWAEGEALLGVDTGVLPPGTSFEATFDFARAFARARTRSFPAPPGSAAPQPTPRIQPCD